MVASATIRVCVAMRGRRACCSVESRMRVLLVGNLFTVSEAGEVLRWLVCGPGCSVLFRSREWWPGGGGFRWKSCKLYGKVRRSSKMAVPSISSGKRSPVGSNSKRGFCFRLPCEPSEVARGTGGCSRIEMLKCCGREGLLHLDVGRTVEQSGKHNDVARLLASEQRPARPGARAFGW